MEIVRNISKQKEVCHALIKPVNLYNFTSYTIV